jgi:hypothetical protein
MNNYVNLIIFLVVPGSSDSELTIIIGIIAAALIALIIIISSAIVLALIIKHKAKMQGYISFNLCLFIQYPLNCAGLALVLYSPGLGVMCPSLNHQLMVGYEGKFSTGDPSRYMED